MNLVLMPWFIFLKFESIYCYTYDAFLKYSLNHFFDLCRPLCLQNQIKKEAIIFISSYVCLCLFVYQVDDFLQALVSYDKEHIPDSCLAVVKQEYLRNPDFQPDLVYTKSTAAAGLCAWTINIVRYYEVRCCL